MFNIAIVFALVAVAIWSISGTIERKVAQRLHASRSALLVASFGVIPILMIFVLSVTAQNGYIIILSLLSGVFWTIGAVLLYKTLETEQVSNATGFVLIQTLLIFAFGVVGLGESVSVLSVVGGAILVCGVALLATKMGSLKLNRKLLPALFGNLGFAVYWILLSAGIVSAGQIAAPMILSRIASSFFAIALFALFAKAQPKKVQVGKSAIMKHALLFGAVAGLLDGLGNGINSFVVTLGQLAIAGIIFSLSPLFTIMLARIFYKERLDKVQWIGVAVAIIGAIILAVG